MGMEQWVQLDRVTGTVVQGCASYYASRALTSSQRPYEQVQCCHLCSFLASWLDGQNLRSLETTLLLGL